MNSLHLKMPFIQWVHLYHFINLSVIRPNTLLGWFFGNLTYSIIIEYYFIGLFNRLKIFWSATVLLASWSLKLIIYFLCELQICNLEFVNCKLIITFTTFQNFSMVLTFLDVSHVCLWTLVQTELWTLVLHTIQCKIHRILMINS